MVVYLRAIFYPEGFVFPLTDFGVGRLFGRLLLTEVGREAATLVIILSGGWLLGQNRRQRFAYFLTIFAVWDIFYYVWLKVLVNWPASVMDWDILFLIPAAWASPVLAPLLISVTMLIFAWIILYRDSCSRPVKAAPFDLFGFAISALVVVVSFCVAGRYIAQPDFEYYFYWPVFALGYVFAIALFAKCFLKSK